MRNPYASCDRMHARVACPYGVAPIRHMAFLYGSPHATRADRCVSRVRPCRYTDETFFWSNSTNIWFKFSVTEDNPMEYVTVATVEWALGHSEDSYQDVTEWQEVGHGDDFKVRARGAGGACARVCSPRAASVVHQMRCFNYVTLLFVLQDKQWTGPIEVNDGQLDLQVRPRAHVDTHMPNNAPARAAQRGLLPALPHVQQHRLAGHADIPHQDRCGPDAARVQGRAHPQRALHHSRVRARAMRMCIPVWPAHSAYA